jgi:hypothetical protein
MFRAAADLVIALHAAFALFVVLGGLLVLRWRWVRWVHVPAAIWGVLIEFGGWVCPLTPLETYLRERGGAQGYQGRLHRDPGVTLNLYHRAIDHAVAPRVALLAVRL